ncbi:Pass1-related protein [Pseudoalteromonas luteoviolacea B = ATCC 29581]|nr:Pass1-related protein [Pseudoalteromonas luteoviolacea B = ATCC 29581]
MFNVTSLSNIALASPNDWPSLLTSLGTLDKPLVFKGLVEHWPLVTLAKRSTKEAIELLQQDAVAAPLTVYHIGPEDDGKVFYDEHFTGFNYRVLQGSFAQLAQQLTGDQNRVQRGSYYLGSTLVDRYFPTIDKSHELSVEFNKPLKSLWLGGKSKVPAHNDYPLNLVCNVIGKRRFVLFPPNEVSNLYIGPLEKTPSGRPISLVDLNYPDFDRFPLFQNALANAQYVDLEPGDALFIPSMWWHYVEGLEHVNGQINYWWREDSPACMAHDALSLALIAVRDLPEHEKSAWKALFNHYVFETNDFEHIPAHLKGILSKPNTQAAQELKYNLAAKLSRR